MSNESVQDPVLAIQKIDSITQQVKSLQDMAPGMIETAIHAHTGQMRERHALESVLEILDACRIGLMSKYGRMMWEAGQKDGLLGRPTNNQPHRERNIFEVPQEVLAQIYKQAYAQAQREALEDGRSDEPSVGEVEPERSPGILRRLLGKASSRKIQ